METQAKTKKMKYGKMAPLIYLINYKLNKLLFYLRGNNPSIPEPNKWSLFGGVLEEGETKESGLKRELKEEINIPVSQIDYLGQMKNSEGQILYFSKGKIYGDKLIKIKITEGQRVNYFAPHKIAGNNFETSVEEFYRKNKGEILK